MTANVTPPSPLTDTTPTDESLIWVADLLASLGLPSMETEAAEAEDDDADDEVGGAELAAVDQDPPIAETSEGLALSEFDYAPEEDGSVLGALFGWLSDIFNALFGGQGDDGMDVAEDSEVPPADVSEDLVLNAVEPDQAYLDQLEEDLAALEDEALDAFL